MKNDTFSMYLTGLILTILGPEAQASALQMPCNSENA